MDQQKSIQEVVDDEKQMLSLIHSKAILDNDVFGLYRKIRAVYENALLDRNQMVRHREIEYRLWRLHYQLIDEFRKKIRKQSHNAENAKTDHSLESMNSKRKNDKGQTGLLLFLTEANEFYQGLILKIRKSCGLVEEIFLNYKDHVAISVEPQKADACRYTCHRLLVCLGDLARYAEFVKKTEACDWSTAAKYYLEATRTWPDSGNPHNQLALLATYVGDSFLALYHCVRSLALEEPFPDAWRNIMLLFEENRSTKLPSLSSQMKLDFSNPSKKIHSHEACDEENNCSENLELWPLLVRTISFLVIRSRNAILSLSTSVRKPAAVSLRPKISRVCFTSASRHPENASEDDKTKDYNPYDADEAVSEPRDDVQVTIDRAKEKTREMKEKTREAAEEMNEKTKEKLGPMADKAQEMRDKAMGSAQEMKDRAGDKARKMADTAKERAHETKETTKGMAEKAADTAKERAQKAKETTKGTAEKVTDTAKERAHEAKETTKGMAEKVADTAKERAHEAKETTKGMAEKVADTAKETVRKIKETVVGKSEDVEDYVEDHVSEEGKEKVMDEDVVDRRRRAAEEMDQNKY